MEHLLPCLKCLENYEEYFAHIVNVYRIQSKFICKLLWLCGIYYLTLPSYLFLFLRLYHASNHFGKHLSLVTGLR